MTFLKQERTISNVCGAVAVWLRRTILGSILACGSVGMLSQAYQYSAFLRVAAPELVSLMWDE